MTKFRISLLSGVACALSAVFLAPMTGASAQQSYQRAGQQLTLAVGKSAIIDLPRDAAEIFVGNPSVANAIVRTPRRLFILGTGNGQTSIYALDKEGNRFLDLDLRIGRDIGELRQILKTAMPNADIEVRTVNDTIILTGSVDSAAEAQKASDIASAFVGYSVVGTGGAMGNGNITFGSSTVVEGKLINSIVIRGRDQVMVKVTIAEVQRAVVKQLGIEGYGRWSVGSAAYPAGFNLNHPLSQTIGSINGGSDFNMKAGSATIGAVIRSLERAGVARILSEPTVVAISGETGKFLAGGEVQVPISVEGGQGYAGSATCKVAYSMRKYGVSLSMTPIVLSEGRIQMHVATEVTEVDPASGPMNGACPNQPGFRTRAHETTLELPSGGSIVSAGLIQQRSRQFLTGQPGLMNLPILGTLFRSRDFLKEETELMIVMSPYIVQPTRPDRIARPDDGFQEASDGQGYFLGRVNRIYATAKNPQLLNNLKGRVGFIND
jgi:pilus assembly protein CpaC